MNEQSGCQEKIEQQVGCLIALMITLVMTWWFINHVSRDPVTLHPEPERQQEECEISLGVVPASLDPLDAVDERNKLLSFWYDTNPFPQSPGVTIRRALIAIQERQQSHYETNFEESTLFPDQELGSGVIGRFYNVRIHLLDHDEQTAKVQVRAIWVPSRIGSEYPEGTALIFCQRLMLVRARKRLSIEPGLDQGGALVDIGINLSGWYLREDQPGKLPYYFSRLFDRLLEKGYKRLTPTPTISSQSDILQPKTVYIPPQVLGKERNIPCWGWILVVVIAVLVWFLWWLGRLAKEEVLGDETDTAIISQADDSSQSATEPTPPTPDDLTLIRGIGPKIATLLQKTGITTFIELASTNVADLERILKKGNISLADPSTWPDQAILLVMGDFEAFENLKKELRERRQG